MKNKQPIGAFFKRFSGWIAGVLTFLSVLVGLIIPFRDNPELVTILTILTISVALAILLVRIGLKKPARAQSERMKTRGLPIRFYAFGGLILLVMINLSFFISRPGRNLLSTAVNGTATLTPSPVPTITPIPSATPTATPQWDDLVAIESEMVCGGYEGYIIPESVDLGQDPLELMDTFYAQRVWNSWDVVDSPYAIDFKITNKQPNGGMIVIDNAVYMVIDSYEPLGHVNLAQFSIMYCFSGAGCGCGGGGTVRVLSAAEISNSPDIASSSSEYDYFTLQSGEVEMFLVPVHCGESGVYTYHFEMGVSYLGNKDRIVVSPTMSTFCPESYSRWEFSGVTSADFANDVYEPNVVEYQGDFSLVPFSDQNTSAIIESKWSYPYPYVLSEPSTYWVKYRAWKPCPDAPETTIYPDNLTTDPMVNPDLGYSVRVYAEPTIASQVVSYFDPGEKIRNPSPEESFVCSNGMIWWNASYTIRDSTGAPVSGGSGWIPEIVGGERWLVSCVGNPDCK